MLKLKQQYRRLLVVIAPDEASMSLSPFSPCGHDELPFASGEPSGYVSQAFRKHPLNSLKCRLKAVLCFGTIGFNLAGKTPFCMIRAHIAILILLESEKQSEKVSVLNLQHFSSSTFYNFICNKQK